MDLVWTIISITLTMACIILCCVFIAAHIWQRNEESEEKEFLEEQRELEQRLYRKYLDKNQPTKKG